MVMRKLILFFLLLPIFLSAQQAYNQNYVDSLSYDYFTQYEYGKLEQLGKESLEAGIDFYYLRLRLGIVAFKQEKYETAWPHFERAEKLLPGEPVVLEYLYWSYRYTAQNDKANALFEKYEAVVSRFLPGIVNKQISEIEMGTLQTQNARTYENQYLLEGNDNEFRGNFFSSMYYLRLYQEQRFKKNWRVFAGAGVYQVHNFSSVWYIPISTFPNPPLPPDSFSIRHTDPNFQLNLGVSKLFKKGVRASLSGGYYHERFTYNLEANRSSTTYTNYLSLAASLSKKFKFVEPVLLLSSFDVLDMERIQAELGATLFPFKRNLFYSYTSLGYAFTQITETQGIVLQQKFGLQIKKGPQLQASFLLGELDNYMGNLGFVTLNTFDPVNWLASVQAEFKSTKFTWIPGYQIQSRTGTYNRSQYAFTDIIVSSQNVDYTYLSHLFYLTLRYTP